MSLGMRGARVETKSLTYAELGAALGITPASAKRLAIRRLWPKAQGNDGLARVAVPIERLSSPKHPAPAAGDAPGDDIDASPGDDTGDDAGGVTDDVPTIVGMLRAQVGRLEADLEKATAGLDDARAALEVERIRAAQVDVLKAMLDAEKVRVEDANRRVEDVRASERQRVEDIKVERDRWAVQAEKLLPLAETGSRMPAWWPFKRRA